MPMHCLSDETLSMMMYHLLDRYRRCKREKVWETEYFYERIEKMVLAYHSYRGLNVSQFTFLMR